MHLKRRLFRSEIIKGVCHFRGPLRIVRTVSPGSPISRDQLLIRYTNSQHTGDSTATGFCPGWSVSLKIDHYRVADSATARVMSFRKRWLNNSRLLRSNSYQSEWHVCKKLLGLLTILIAQAYCWVNSSTWCGMQIVNIKRTHANEEDVYFVIFWRIGMPFGYVFATTAGGCSMHDRSQLWDASDKLWICHLEKS